MRLVGFLRILWNLMLHLAITNACLLLNGRLALMLAADNRRCNYDSGLLWILWAFAPEILAFYRIALKLLVQYQQVGVISLICGDSCY
jgi:hypothetical protein